MNPQDPDNDNDNDAIDLGETPEPLGELGAPTKPSPSEPSYPTVMLSGGPELHRIADNGVHKIHAKVIAKHFPHKYSKHHRVELELHKIKPQMKRGRPSPKKNDEDRSAIRSLMEKEEQGAA